MWNAIYRKLWILILLPLLAGGIAYFIAGRKSSQYKSVAVIEASIPDQPAGKTLKDLPEPDQYYENLAQTMKTEVITSMASYRLLLHDLEQEIAFRAPAIQYTPQKKDLIRARLEKKLSSFELLSDTDPTEQTIFRLLTTTDYNLARWIRDKEMIVERRPNTNDIEVVSQTEDPFLSAYAANALAQEYIRYETAMTAPPSTVTPSNDSIGWYRDEVERLRKDLEQKTSELKEAGSKPSSKGGDDMRFRRAKANKISEFEMRIVEEEWEVNNLREQLAKSQRPETAESSRPADVATNAKIQTIKKKIDQLSKIYAEGGSKDRQLDSIINKLRRQVTDETLRLQVASQKTVATTTAAPSGNRSMIETRIRRHEDNIVALRNDIRRLKNTNTAPAVSGADISKLTREQQAATTAYNAALASLQKAESKQPVQVASARASHHLILKEKALPSAEPESPWAIAIILSAVIGTMAVCLVVIYVTRPAPKPYDDIFLKVNYGLQKREKENENEEKDKERETIVSKKERPRKGELAPNHFQ